MNFWKRANLFPPRLCRLLARKRYGGPMTSKEIADKSGLSVSLVEYISDHDSWEGVYQTEMEKFLKGCGVDFCDLLQMKRVGAYLRSKPNFEYLREDPLWKEYYLPLMVKWLRATDHTGWKPLDDLLKRMAPLKGSK